MEKRPFVRCSSEQLRSLMDLKNFTNFSVNTANVLHFAKYCETSTSVVRYGNSTDEDTDEVVFGYRPRELSVLDCSLALLGLLGVLGNAMSIIVWTRPQMRSSSAILLTVLAGSDLLIVSCLHTLQFLGELVFRYETPTTCYVNKFIWAYVLYWLFPIGFTAQMASVYLTLLIAFERYLAVCHPFDFQEVLTQSRAYKSAAAVVFFSILYNLSRFWEREVRPIYSNGNITSYRNEPTELFQDPLYESIFMTWLYLLFNNLLPLAAIVILNTTIYRKLKKSRRRRKIVLSDLERKENRLSMMLVYVVAEFFVCSSVTTFFSIVNIIFDLSGYHPGFNLMEQLIPVDEFLYIFNSSANFVTYITFGRPFRRAFVKIFVCSRKRRQRCDGIADSGNKRVDSDHTDMTNSSSSNSVVKSVSSLSAVVHQKETAFCFR
ncbi:hypothetical protein GE061_009883 [Apolygus lucorum]|uniref:G-protein coupled receptors family 1 profile domain-containing protein n=1 Tax=Apolygus lucorum TaxID=248454 RepID=A0A8S9Y1R7_APOLU|nr:hypothetical protein GE061_009883 [Apolygus lucorum]